MRKFVLFFLILLTGCAFHSSEPVSPEALKAPPLTSVKAQVDYRLKIPRKELSGRLLLLADPLGHLYFETLSPFGLALFQGNLFENYACGVFFPKQEVLILVMEQAPPSLTKAWTYLLLGQIPASWLSRLSWAQKTGHQIKAYFDLEENLKVEGIFSPFDYQLQKLVIKYRGRTLIKAFYQRKDGRLLATKIKVPLSHLTLCLKFLRIKPASLSPDFFVIYPPRDFQIKTYSFPLA